MHGLSQSLFLKIPQVFCEPASAASVAELLKVKDQQWFVPSLAMVLKTRKQRFNTVKIRLSWE